MKYYLFTDSDTRLEFSSRGKAFVYADKHNIPSVVLTEYETHPAISVAYNYSVFNPFLTSTNCVEYFKNENDALKYIGSFLIGTTKAVSHE